MAKRKKAPKKDVSNYVISTIVVILIVAAVYMVMNNPIPTDKSAAVVNGEVITIAELDERYESLPEQYKVLITKEFYLDQLINTKLLLQEARSLGIVVSIEEVNEEIDLIAIDFETEEEFDAYISESGLTREELAKQIEEKILIDKLLEEKVYSQIDIPESRVKIFYDNNKDQIEQEYDEIKEDIEDMLKDDIASSAINTYINQLKSKADISMNGDTNKVETDVIEETDDEINIGNFIDTGDAVCMKDEKPIVRLFSTTNCEKCNEISGVFDSLSKEFSQIDIAHWQLNTGDNTITEDAEEGITKSDLELFKKYSPENKVPTLVFGCKYTKIGNVGDINEEKESYKIVITEILK